MESPLPRKMKAAVIVEGKYDQIRLASVADTLIIPTEGFGIFENREKLAWIRQTAETRGVVLLLDSDGAGFVIRSFLAGCLPKDRVKHAYIPDRPGKERRKAQPSKEGKLGVEGMETEVLLEALERCGAFEEAVPVSADPIVPADLFEAGLSGRPDSAARRDRLKAALDLPKGVSAKALLRVLNGRFSKEEFYAFCRKLENDEKE